MDTTVDDRLSRIEGIMEGLADRQKADGDLLRMVAEQQAEIIKLLTPKEKDGPSIDELLGHMIGQLTELTGYARQTIKMLGQMEQNLPGDVARAREAGAGGSGVAGGSGAGFNGSGPNGASRSSRA